MTTFYGIHIPSLAEVPDDLKLEPYYTDKLKALAILKKVKPARMKVFSTCDEAEKFHKAVDISPPQQVPAEQVSPKPNTGIVSESLPYKTVPTRDLSQFRLAIERGDREYVINRIAENPRYLISAGDTPTVLNERFRYNALHSCSMKGQTEIAELLLNILSSDELYCSVYPSDSVNMRYERRDHLIDLYLNTPDKGTNETALHFASKFGHVSLIELYINEPLVQADVRNRNGDTPYDVAATRSGTAADKRKIRDLLKGQYYVALYRSVEDDVTPVISEPWSPILNQHDSVFSDSPISDIQNVTSPLRAAHNLTLPRSLGLSPCRKSQSESTLIVRACAGPMSKQQAGDFKRCWSSPGSPRVAKLKSETNEHISDAGRRDPYKGLETMGRTLADEQKVKWNEFWSFLKCSVDLNTEIGLERLEAYFTGLEESPSPQDEEEPPVNSIVPEAPTGPSGDIAPSPTATPDLNTTDERLAHFMNGLTLHSPNSPYLKSRKDNSKCGTAEHNSKPLPAADECDSSVREHNSKSLLKYSASERNSNRHRNTSSRAHNSSNSSNDGLSVCKTPTRMRGDDPPNRATPRRTYIEMAVPSIALVLDKIRLFWPFGGSGQSPKPVLDDSISGADITDDSSTHDTQSNIIQHTGDHERITPVKNKPTPAVFIEGRQVPSKLDNDVLQALRTADIDEDKYPSLYRWLNRISQYSTQEQNSWPTPQTAGSLRRRILASTSSPQLSTPSSSAGDSFRRLVSAPKFELD